MPSNKAYRRIGVISLEYKGKIISTKKYDGVYNRNFIINGWRKLYGQRFYECFFIISPEAKIDLVDENGLNGFHKK